MHNQQNAKTDYFTNLGSIRRSIVCGQERKKVEVDQFGQNNKVNRSHQNNDREPRLDSYLTLCLTAFDSRTSLRDKREDRECKINQTRHFHYKRNIPREASFRQR